MVREWQIINSPCKTSLKVEKSLRITITQCDADHNKKSSMLFEM